MFAGFFGLWFCLRCSHKYNDQSINTSQTDKCYDCIHSFFVLVHKYLSFYIYFITISMQATLYVKKKEQAHRAALKKRNVLNIILIIYLLYTPLDALCASIF